MIWAGQGVPEHSNGTRNGGGGFIAEFSINAAPPDQHVIDLQDDVVDIRKTEAVVVSKPALDSASVGASHFLEIDDVLYGSDGALEHLPHLTLT